MKKNMTFKQFLFIVPLLAIIAVFSLYPIISSFVYTAFDYRTNDQQASQLFLSGSLNTDLFYEDCDYINYYLEDDISMVDEQGQADFRAISDKISAMKAEFEGQTGFQDLSADEAERISGFLDATLEELMAVYERYPDVVFYNKDSMPVLIEEMRSCLVEPNFTGLENFRKLVSDERFFHALLNTLFFTVISVAVEFVIGMALALIMNKAMRGIGLIRTTSLIPWAIPTAVSALIWSYLYDGSSGIISRLFANMGLIDAPQNMLLSSGGAMSAAILADIWKTAPYMALLLLGGLQVIDRGLYESASIDGSGAVNTFFRITLPLMKPSILVALLFRTLDAFRVYDLIAILTGGGPGGATETLSIYAYKVMIGQSNYGYGSAIVVAMFVCVAIIAVLFVKVLGAEVVRDD